MNEMFDHALVLGKFYPPHAGHHHLVRAAAARSTRTTVAVLGASVESIPLADRVRWLAEEHAADRGVAVVGDVDDHPIDFHDDRTWELHIGIVRAVLARPAIADGDPAGAGIDAVFSGESYGAELASRLGAEHVAVDPDRTTHPVSGTAVRADPVGRWAWLAPATRAGLAARVVVVGAESTGTTTLSAALAAHLLARGGAFADTRWVAEYGRTHTELKLAAATAQAGGTPPDLDGLVWTVGDFVDVAHRQAADAAARTGGPVLVCDNDPWAATAWCERYLGACPQDVHDAVGGRRPALYLLTDHRNVPFEQDGRRDGAHRREWLTGRFAELLDERGVPWRRLTGDPERRLTRAVEAVDGLLDTHFTYAHPLT
ncbi:MAG: AAA family ATPase [Actinophytocola sp.]|uniref:AAA family ATPase n=1 Tax=Actinophytocola sp. TaxID=1872138 RepID=UPI0013290A84|nr:AAA family ATPase [Actinophytocola sp.]MPZ83862.1 AAA family ATPase [Actinophytocola sp.]